MQKIDYKKVLKQFYSQGKDKVSLVDVPAMNFLMIDGVGDPNNNPAYSAAVGALYTLAYALKFHVKKSSLQIDYAVMPLEGLWWADDMVQFNLVDRHLWKWSMLIMQPDCVTAAMVEQMRSEAIQKKGIPELAKVRFETFNEGKAAQIFHSGAYGEAELPTTAKLHAFIEENGFRKSGKHHEIYFNSPLRTAAEKLRTIIRQPVSK